MLVLGIYGSPRKGGNTDLLMDSFLDGAASAGAPVERVYARDLSIGGCLGCGYCDKQGKCIQKDDMQEVYSLFDKASHVVVASPIYFYGVPGQLKLLIDRSQAKFMHRELARQENRWSPSTNRSGFLLCAGATRGKRLFDCTILCVKYFFDALDIGYKGELCYREIDERGAIRNHPSALEESFQAGKALVSEG